MGLQILSDACEQPSYTSVTLDEHPPTYLPSQMMATMPVSIRTGPEEPVKRQWEQEPNTQQPLHKGNNAGNSSNHPDSRNPNSPETATASGSYPQGCLNAVDNLRVTRKTENDKTLLYVLSFVVFGFLVWCRPEICFLFAYNPPTFLEKDTSYPTRKRGSAPSPHPNGSAGFSCRLLLLACHVGRRKWIGNLVPLSGAGAECNRGKTTRKGMAQW